MQRFTPMLAYADAAAALEFLTRAFGFEVRFRMDLPDGSVGHAELGLGGEVVMLASEWPAGGVVSPLQLPALRRAASASPARRSRGMHGCEFCGLSEPRPILDRADPNMMLGSAEIWIRDSKSGIVFAAPDLVIHYIDRHGYRPPRVFVEAALAFDPDGWDGAAFATAVAGD